MSACVRWVVVAATIAVLAGRSVSAPPALKEKVLLEWKVPEGGALALKTSMENLEPGSGDVDLKPIFEALAQMLGVDEALKEAQQTEPTPEQIARDRQITREMKQSFRALQLPDSYSTTTVLTPRPNGNLSVKIIMALSPEMEKPKESPAKFFRDMLKGVQLRGEITPRGKIASFWLESKQKNLLAMFFGLPGRPVKVGDVWPLEVSLVSMGHGFICETASRVNQVRLVSVEDTGDGDRVATLDYLLFERVEGRFKMPMGGKAVPSTMAFGFTGRGKFLVGKGRWRKFVAVTETTSTGFMPGHAKQRLAMEPMDKVPKAYLKME